MIKKLSKYANCRKLLVFENFTFKKIHANVMMELCPSLTDLTKRPANKHRVGLRYFIYLVL